MQRSSLHRRALSALFVIVGLAMSPVAAAQSNDPALAETLFQEGTKLFDAGKFAEASLKFAASQKADPKSSTAFDLGLCNEKLGKTASAWAAFHEAAALAKDPPDAKAAGEKAGALEPKLVFLRISVASAPQGLAVTRDGAAVDRAAWGTAVPVDPGSYRIEVSAPGKKTWSVTAVAKGEGKTFPIDVPALEDAPVATVTPSATQVEASPTFGVQRGLALTAGGVGVLGLVLGGALGAVAKSKWDGAKSHCDAQHACDPFGLAEGNDARSLATGSTVGFGVGAAGVVAGIVLWITAPAPAPSPKSESALRAAPWLGRDGGGLVFHGSF